MSFSEAQTQNQIPQTPLWDPSQGDLSRQHVLYPSQISDPETPQQLISAGWSTCPRCHESWISPENKAQILANGGYYTCPRCKLTTDLMENMPWHGAVEEHYYPRGNTGGGTSIGLPMRDVGVIAENIVRKMGQIPGYGPIVWWSDTYNSPLDGATHEWGIEVKGIVYDSASHFWHPGTDQAPDFEITKKLNQARDMGLTGILGVLVTENFRNDTADVYVKPMPLGGYMTPNGIPKTGLVKWHKRTGEKVASNVPFENPMKDPNNPAPGPYSLADYYQPPQAPWESTNTPAEDMPF